MEILRDFMYVREGINYGKKYDSSESYECLLA